jgi:cysteine synthase A
VEEKTRELVERLQAFRPDQFLNPDNAAAHEQTTGREIWEQTGGRVDAFCALVGTGGTFVGVARTLKARNPAVRCYAVEPAGAPVLAGRRVKNPRHKLQGGGYAFVPPLWDPACCDGFLTATDAEAIRVARRLGREEGICAGFSSGANVAAALRLARRAAPGETVVTIIADTGLRYLSTDLYPA